MQNEKIYKHYVFLDRFNKIVESNLLKFSNIIIIIDINQNDNKSLNEQSLIINFLKKYRIPFLIKNDYRKCQKYKADGIFIESINKKNIRPILLKKKFQIIGGAHNQLEYYQKYRQNCSVLMLSPLFENKKYTSNKILNILRFNIKSLHWNIKLCALGGINSNTIKKVKLTKCIATSFKSFIFDPKIKKPAYNLM